MVLKVHSYTHGPYVQSMAFISSINRSLRDDVVLLCTHHEYMRQPVGLIVPSWVSQYILVQPSV